MLWCGRGTEGTAQPHGPLGAGQYFAGGGETAPQPAGHSQTAQNPGERAGRGSLREGRPAATAHAGSRSTASLFEGAAGAIRLGPRGASGMEGHEARRGAPWHGAERLRVACHPEGIPAAESRGGGAGTGNTPVLLDGLARGSL